MLSNPFKANWQDPNPEKRLKAIPKLSANVIEEREILNKIALEDDDQDVREAAVKANSHLESLFDIEFKSTQPHLKSVAGEQIQALLFEELDQENKEFQNSLFDKSDATYQHQLLIINANQKKPDIGLKFLAKIDQPELLRDIVMKAVSLEIKKQALEKINDVNLLEGIEKSFKGKEKTIFRIAQEKVSKLKTIAQDLQNIEDEKNKLVGAFKTLSTSTYHPLYKSKLAQLRNDWTSFIKDQSVDENDKLAVEQSADICETVIKDNRSASDIEQENILAITELENALQPDFLLADQLIDQAMDTTSIDIIAIDAKLAELKTRYQSLTSKPATDDTKDAIENSKSDDADKNTDISTDNSADNSTDALVDDSASELKSERFQAKLKQIESLLKSQNKLADLSVNIEALKQQHTEIRSIFSDPAKKPKASQSTFKLIHDLHDKTNNAINSVRWPKDLKPNPQIESLSEVLADSKNLKSAAKAQQVEFSKSCKKKLNFLTAEIKKQSLKNASRLKQDIDQSLEFCLAKDKVFFDKKLADLLPELKKLEDWQNFAVTPKKEALCEKMEALAATKIKALKLQKEIQTLQNEWKSLGYTNDENAEALWLRFKEAGDIAYQSVQAFFDQKDQEKVKNLEKRKAILTELTEFYEKNLSTIKKGETEAWKQAEKYLRKSIARWKDFSALPKGQEKTHQEAFSKIVGDIELKLNTERKINIGISKALLEKANKLSELTDNQEAISEAKQLQQQWKNIGISDHKEQNAIWKSFQESCNAVFNIRDDLHQKEKVELKETKSKAEQILLELGQVISEPDEGFAKSLEQLDKAFRALSLDKKKNIGLIKQHQTLIKQSSKVLVQQQQQAFISNLALLDEIIGTLAENENLVLTKVDDQQSSDQAFTSIKEIIDKASIDKEASELLRSRLDKLSKAFQSKSLAGFADEQNVSAREICIELELMFEIESPSEDQKLRMNIQVKRLNAALKKADEQDKDKQVKKLLLSWYTMILGESDQGGVLKQRFLALSKKSQSLL